MSYLSPQVCAEVIALAVRRHGLPWVLETVTLSVREGAVCTRCGYILCSAVVSREVGPPVTDPRLLPEKW